MGNYLTIPNCVVNIDFAVPSSTRTITNDLSVCEDRLRVTESLFQSL
ncbi:hypothetical protein ECA0586 [Pectobacterium atrosepticum SCRI1043]|uniref:Uncharacterized protein n=2 Tax=Pectobacterium atrosepticum TaxID=29471 RepID=Q6D9M9_PECAS|nr:hypothetical protein KCQ_13156 [Pectobacterium atrosepticum]CAG73501.1 hypothetical protein ECA0586 [Pectobacterium atrosepticum SCRI1043]